LQLNLGKDWLQIYLPHVLQKIDRVSFGIMNGEDYERAVRADPRMPRTRAKLAIPFVGKDVPSRSSEFAHPDVIIGLTVLAYRYEGLRWTDFEDLIGHMRATMTKELGPCSTRRSSLRYAAWVREAGGYIFGADDEEGGEGSSATNNTGHSDAGDDTSGGMVIESVEPTPQAATATSRSELVVSLRLLKRSNEDQMKKIYNLFRLLPDVIHYYLENFIFPAYTESKIVKLSAAGAGKGLFQGNEILNLFECDVQCS
jgi:hypothetical protein